MSRSSAKAGRDASARSGQRLRATFVVFFPAFFPAVAFFVGATIWPGYAAVPARGPAVFLSQIPTPPTLLMNTAAPKAVGKGIES